MKLPRRQFLRFMATAAAFQAVPRSADAQSYPARPVRIVVGFSPGGPQDILARLIGQWLSDRTGQSFFVENRPGAGGNIAAELVVRSPPDGYTLLMVGPPNAINASFYEKLSFNFIRDIAPVAALVRVPNVLEIYPGLPVRTVPELIAYAKANPGKLNMASAGSGTSQHVSGELFKMMTGVSMQHVPYRGAAPALADLIAGQVQVMIDNTTSSIGHIRAGKLRPLAVTTATRWQGLPDIPTVDEFIPGYETSTVNGIGAPAGTPPEIVGQLNREINAALADQPLRTKLADLGGTILAGSPSEYARLIVEETEKWAKVVKFAGLKAE